MTKSPCIGCELEDADKNNPTCRECERRVEYVALIEGDRRGIMGATEKTEVRDQTSEVGDQESKVCIVKGCEKKIAARDFCSTHFSAWQDGRIKHPILGEYFKIRHQKKKPKVKKTVAAVPGVKANLPGALKVDLNNYPKIKHQIDFLADKYLVNSEHVIIGLLGEALAARRERSDNE